MNDLAQSCHVAPSARLPSRDSHEGTLSAFQFKRVIRVVALLSGSAPCPAPLQGQGHERHNDDRCLLGWLHKAHRFSMCSSGDHVATKGPVP
eukprot:763612-Hanusia_phi.AAC.22